jgi:hypothetical protein
MASSSAKAASKGIAVISAGFLSATIRLSS